MKAIRKTVLRWMAVRAEVKIMPLIESKSIPKEKKVHSQCNQEIKTEKFCPKCGEVFKPVGQTTCPNCGKTFIYPDIEKICSNCKKAVEKPDSGEWCPHCGVKLTNKDIKEVYPVGHGKLMGLSRKEKKEWQQVFPNKEEINVVSIVRRKNINPVYFDTTYTLVPVQGGEFGYAFFKEMVADDELAFVADVVIRTNHRALIFHHQGRLFMTTLINNDEIVLPEIPKIELPQGLIEKGLDAIFEAAERMFDPKKHALNLYRLHFENLVARKIEGKEVEEVPSLKPLSDKVKEMTKQIEESLEEARKKSEKESRKEGQKNK